jgi:hypothetical protein
VDEEVGDDTANEEEALAKTDLVVTTAITGELIKVDEEVTVEDVEDDKTSVKRSTMYITSQATGLLSILLTNARRRTANSVSRPSTR